MARLLFLVLLLINPAIAGPTDSSFSVTIDPAIGQQTFAVPLNIRFFNNGLALEHKLALYELGYPSSSYLIHDYDRSGITLINEVSELSWQVGAQKFIAGRNYHRSGPVRYNAGLFSAFTPSLNRFSYQVWPVENLKYEFTLVRLDDRPLDEGVVKRWIYYRRLEIPLGQRVSLGLKDVVLATGIQRGVDLGYLNPTAVYQLDQLHGNLEDGTRGSNNDNQIMAADLEMRLNKGRRVYLDFVLDEFQIDAADRKNLQDVFGMTLGIETNETGLTFFELWLASPWLYTNGGVEANYEVNGLPLGYTSPNAYGLTLGLEREYSKYSLAMVISLTQSGEQTVSTEWASMGNRLPLKLTDGEWEPELDVSIRPQNLSWLKELRLTHDLLDSQGTHLILTFKGLEYTRGLE